MRKNILAIRSLVLAFPLMGQAMQSAISIEKTSEDYPTPDRSKVLAFPDTDGAGKYTTDGAGGTVYIATSLVNDGSEGTFRWVISRKGSRTIVFAVSGIIELQKTLELGNNGMTIAGQAAPGDGTCLENYTFSIQADNVIIRFIRSRVGVDIRQRGDDAANGTKTHQNITIDHYSMNWYTDECTTFYDNRNFTLQQYIVNESLANSIHEEGAYGYGGIWGGQPTTSHHNLLTHHTGRTSRLCGNRYMGRPESEKVKLFSNVVYNYDNDGVYAGEGGSYSFVNNYYKPGPFSVTKGSFKRLFTAYTDDDKNNNKAGVRDVLYFRGSYMDPTCPKLTDKQKEALYKVNMDNPCGLVTKKDFTTEKEILSKKTFDVVKRTSLQPAKRAYKDVPELTGASYRRDAMDQHIVDETLKGTYTYEGSHESTNRMIDRPSDVGGRPEYGSEAALVDTDGDGIPNEWEKEHNLNPNDSSDEAEYALGPEYTNLEIYMDSLVNYLYPKK